MKTIILVVIFANPGHGRLERTYEMSSWDQCLESVKTARTEYSQGAESEGGFIAFCADK